MYKISQEDYCKINLLSELASYQIEDILDDLGVKYKKSGKMFVGCCPIHSGDKYNAWNLYPDGYSVKGIWCCRTKSCEKVFQKTIPGLIRGILSKEKGWTLENNKMIPFKESINYLCNFLNQDWKNIKVDLSKQQKQLFVSSIERFGFNKSIKKEGWSINQIKKNYKFHAIIFFLEDFLIKY